MTTANKRTYLVLDKGTSPPVGRLVKTISTQRAVEFVVGERYDVRIATQDDLIFALSAGVKVEEPGTPAASTPNPGRRASDAQNAAAAKPVEASNEIAPNLVSVAA